jgi:predicted ATP-grasp superfamily ATP-dependent carboligase
MQGWPDGWITKRIGGSGGRHIRFATAASRARPRRYFQRLIEGERISVSSVVTSEGINTAFSRQWAAAAYEMPYRYGGAVGLADDHAAQTSSILACVDQLARGFQLSGLVSFDFMIDGTSAYLLEINPRPGATLDVFDDDQGALFQAHISASQSEPLERHGSDPENCRAAAILHADRGPLTLGKFDWPEWAADRGAPGTHIPLGAPIATVFAEAATSDAAEALARTRLAALESLIYESSKT